ncbi:hypothetical protein CHS0354_014516 [Potamilus streckersoni]|uniref:Nuclease EXOG, mitochondrial n=1 Tax=Potamilus streckersoni TaxID=2493646 RepID=A0AAE0SAW7_9BIVA|nr:hypothetical protein CHS0354_014516 [Potamilus streckersoni]
MLWICKLLRISPPMFLRGFVSGTAVSTVVYAVLYASINRKAIDTASVQSNFEDINKLEQGQEILKYGFPDRGPELMYYTNHVLAYDRAKRTPVWVAEHLTAETLKGYASRKNEKFLPDPRIPEMFSAQNSDYQGSGWSRGHMSPAGNHKISKEAMKDSFFLSNIVPQNYENNAGFWNRLEMYCRDLTKNFQSVRIISGPLVMPYEEEGKKFIKYQIIGNSEVAVPTHLYKIIVAERKSQPVALGVFIIPNEPLDFSHHLTKYQITLPQLESRTGINFVPKLDLSKTVNLCDVHSCQLIEKGKFELYFIGRKLESANTLSRLEHVWKELEEKKLKPDKDLIDLYEKRHKEILMEEKRK